MKRAVSCERIFKDTLLLKIESVSKINLFVECDHILSKPGAVHRMANNIDLLL